MGSKGRNSDNQRGDTFTVRDTSAGSHVVVNDRTGKTQGWERPDGKGAETTTDPATASAVADALNEFNRK